MNCRTGDNCATEVTHLVVFPDNTRAPSCLKHALELQQTAEFVHVVIKIEPLEQTQCVAAK